MRDVIFTVTHNTPRTYMGDLSPVLQTSEYPMRAGLRDKAIKFIVQRGVLIVLALFATAGVLVIDDYGVGLDAGFQRGVAIWHLEYLLGERDFIYPYHNHNRFYGVSFELPLLLVERALSLEDTRDIHLMRHMVTHLFFLVGGLFCYLLTYRLFGNRLLALFAMLLFLLHPRIYAHSFFNSKDVPFLSMFMICLYLAHRAFNRSNIWWFVILGVSVGVLINIRIMGMALFMVVLGMCLLDMFHASDGKDRRRVLYSSGIFVLSCVAAFYAVTPYLWSDSVGRIMEWLGVAADHPNIVLQRFTGELTLSTDVNPLEYVPVWISITTQPVALALGMIGISFVLLHSLFHPSEVLAHARLRFGFLLIGCLMLPIVSAMLLSSNLWDGWRQVYFLYAPLCMLAVFGMHWVSSACSGLRLPAFSRVVKGKTLMYGALGIGCVAGVVSMFSIHPYQHIYFNFIVDRTTPEHLRSQFDMDYWYVSFREAFEHLLERHPSASLHVQTSNALAAKSNWDILAEADRDRMVLADGASDFYITNYYSWRLYEGERRAPTSPLIYSRVIYGSKAMSIAAADLAMMDDAVAADYRDAYDATISKQPDAHADWNVYADDATLTYIKETCYPSDYNASFFLHLTPDDIDDLPDYRRRNGHVTRNFDFQFGLYGVRFDGKCMVTVPLPDDALSGIRTGQFATDGELWDVAINIRAGGESAYRAEYESVVRDDIATSSEFEVHLRDDRLIYVKEPCDGSDIDAEFFLHVVPSDVEVLPSARRESGFDNLDFIFKTRGLMLDGMCVASVGLPDYEMERIRTGQWDPEQQRNLWKEEFDVGAD